MLSGIAEILQENVNERKTNEHDGGKCYAASLSLFDQGTDGAVPSGAYSVQGFAAAESVTVSRAS